jgi:hypothetical protein
VYFIRVLENKFDILSASDDHRLPLNSLSVPVELVNDLNETYPTHSEIFTTSGQFKFEETSQTQTTPIPALNFTNLRYPDNQPRFQ